MSSVSVLLVDDNHTFLRIAKLYLESHRGEVMVAGVAGGGVEALAQAAALQPQVVLLDLAMPDLSGLEVIPRLRALLPAVGIIVLTLLDDHAYRHVVLRAGADDFLAKANLSTELLPAIRRVARARESGAPAGG